MKQIIKSILDKTDLMQFFVGISVMGIFFMLMNALIYRVIPPENKDMVNHAIGLVEGAVIMVVGFYYGSSKGSQKKDETIKQKDEMLMNKEKEPGVQITPSPGATTTTEVTTEH